MTSAADKLYHQQMADAVTKAMIDAGATPEEIGLMRKLGGYQGQYKDDDGVGHVVDMFKWELAPSWDDGPQWPVIDRPARPRIARTKPKVDRNPDEITTCLLYTSDAADD